MSISFLCAFSLLGLPFQPPFWPFWFLFPLFVFAAFFSLLFFSFVCFSGLTCLLPARRDDDRLPATPLAAPLHGMCLFLVYLLAACYLTPRPRVYAGHLSRAARRPSDHPDRCPSYTHVGMQPGSRYTGKYREFPVFLFPNRDSGSRYQNTGKYREIIYNAKLQFWMV